MTIASSVINFPNQTGDNSFVKTMVKVLKAGTTTGTLVASFGLSNVPSHTHVVDQISQDMKSYFNGVIQLSNGTEINLSPTPANENIRENHHFSVKGIDYNETAKIADIMLWTGMSGEAITLNYSEPQLYKFENTYSSRVVDEGTYETTAIHFDDDIYPDTLDDSNLYKFEKQFKSKVVIAGDYSTTPIEWD